MTVDYTPEFKIRRIFEDSQKRLWIAALDRNGLFMLKDGKLTSYMQKDGFPDFRFASAAEDRRGNVFFATPGGGLVRAGDEKLTIYTTADGLINDGVTKVYVDREGTIWAGTSGGLSRLTERAVTSYSIPDGLAADNVYPIYQDRQGKIWIGSWTGLTVYENGIFQNVSERFGVSRDNITSLFEDREGNFWVGTWQGSLLRVKDGQIKRFAAREITASGIRAIYQDRQGNIWLGTGDGLAKFKDDVFTAFTARDGISGKEFYVIYEDSSGRLWIGGDAGLTVYEGGVFTTFSEKDGIAANLVRAIYEDRDHTLWIGTYDGGLYRYRDDRFTRYTTRDGLFDNGVFQIIEDGKENLWISCNLGIYRVRKSDLNDFAEGRAREIASIPYNKRDGMLNSECNGGMQPAGIKAADGKLWFPTQKGVAVIDTDSVPFNSQPPPVVITSIVVGTKPVDINAPVNIEPGQMNLEIHYAGLSYINPELVKFKYMLDGLDADWINAGTRRTAYYPHLPPGKYRFIVLAANRDNVWNRQGASLEITVLPAFWQTWWFRVLAALSVFAAAFTFYRWRVGMLRRANAVRERFARQLIESQEDERKRIAAELHDSLGQSLVLIKNWALLGLNKSNQKDASKNKLAEISEMATEAIKEVREIAYNLGPYQLERVGLKKSVEEMIEKVARSSSVGFEVEIDEIDGRLSRQAEINIFRIVQEAVNNIVKHSEASRAKVSLKPDATNATLIIQDDGKGFSPDDNSNGNGRPGFGLLGMSERVNLLKGEYEIESEPGKGTIIIVYLPYEQSADHL